MCYKISSEIALPQVLFVVNVTTPVIATQCITTHLVVVGQISHMIVHFVIKAPNLVW